MPIVSRRTANYLAPSGKRKQYPFIVSYDPRAGRGDKTGHVLQPGGQRIPITEAAFSAPLPEEIAALYPRHEQTVYGRTEPLLEDALKEACERVAKRETKVTQWIAIGVETGSTAPSYSLSRLLPELDGAHLALRFVVYDQHEITIGDEIQREYHERHPKGHEGDVTDVKSVVRHPPKKNATVIPYTPERLATLLRIARDVHTIGEALKASLATAEDAARHLDAGVDKEHPFRV